jgi:hypothetical protein
MGTIQRLKLRYSGVQPLTNERLRPPLGQLFTKKFGLDSEMAEIKLHREAFHGEWNYEILPRK